MADPSMVDPGDYINMPGSTSQTSDMMAVLFPQQQPAQTATPLSAAVTTPAPSAPVPTASPVSPSAAVSPVAPASSPTASPAIQAVIAGQTPLQNPSPMANQNSVMLGGSPSSPVSGTGAPTPTAQSGTNASQAAQAQSPVQGQATAGQGQTNPGTNGVTMAPPTVGAAQSGAYPAQPTVTRQPGAKPGLSLAGVISAVKGALTGSNPSNGPVTANGAKPNPNDYTMGAWEKRNPILAIGAVLAGLHSRGGLEFASAFVKQEQNQLNEQYSRDVSSYQMTQEAQARSQDAQQRTQQMTMEEGRANQAEADQKQEQSVHDLQAGSELYASLAMRSPSDQEAALKAIDASDPGMLARMGLPSVADMYDKTTGKFVPMQSDDDKKKELQDKTWSAMWEGASKVPTGQLGNYFNGFNNIAKDKFGVPITDPRFGLFTQMPDGTFVFTGKGMTTTAQQQGQGRIDQGNERLALSKLDQQVKQTDTTKREAVDQVYRYSKMVLDPNTARMPAPQQYQFVLDPLRKAMVNAGMLPSDAPRLPLVKVTESPSEYLAKRKLMDEENQNKFSDSMRKQEFQQVQLNKSQEEGYQQAHLDMAKASKVTSDARQLWGVAHQGFEAAQRSFLEAQGALHPSDPMKDPPVDKPGDPEYSNLMNQEAAATSTMTYYQGLLDKYNGTLFPKPKPAPPAPPAPPATSMSATGQNAGAAQGALGRGGPSVAQVRPLASMRPKPDANGVTTYATGAMSKAVTGGTVYQTMQGFHIVVKNIGGIKQYTAFDKSGKERVATQDALAKGVSAMTGGL